MNKFEYLLCIIGVLIFALLCLFKDTENNNKNNITEPTSAVESIVQETTPTTAETISTTNTMTTTVPTTVSTKTNYTNSIILPVNNILQNPQLPTGCEITSATILLNYYGYDVDKLYMADILPKDNNFYYKDGKLIGPNVKEYFIGNPKVTQGRALQCFAPVIEKTINMVLDNKYTAYDITGTSLNDLYSYIDNGQPVAVWATMRMIRGYENEPWIDENGDIVITYRNIHCMVLKGYDATSVYVCDPLGTLSKIDKKLFEDRYNYIGKQAVVIEKN